MSNSMSSDIERSDERIKQTGEVFTPAPLVNELLDRIPREVWSNPEKTFLDPSCGDGNFLVEVLRRKIAHGSTPTQALQTTYGVELMSDNAEACRYRLLEIAGDTEDHRRIVEHNIACADALTFNYWKPTLFGDTESAPTRAKKSKKKNVVTSNTTPIDALV